MKRLTMIAALVLGTLVACNLANAQDAGKGGKGGKGGKMPTVDERLDRMTSELKLTDDQKPKVKKVLEEQQKAIDEARKADPSEARQKFRDAMEDSNKKLKDILTTEQYEKWSTSMKNKRGGGKGGDKKGDTKT